MYADDRRNGAQVHRQERDQSRARHGRGSRRACTSGSFSGGSGTKTASARPIYAIRCGKKGTRSIRWKPPLRWSEVPAALDGIESGAAFGAGGCRASACTSSRTSRTCTRPAAASTRRICSASRPIPTRRCAAGRRSNTAASQVVVAHGGTISHQHGVGTDHAPYLPAEKGALGMATLRALGAHFDPDGIMNPGKLWRDRRNQNNLCALIFCRGRVANLPYGLRIWQVRPLA